MQRTSYRSLRAFFAVTFILYAAGLPVALSYGRDNLTAEQKKAVEDAYSVQASDAALVVLRFLNDGRQDLAETICGNRPKKFRNDGVLAFQHAVLTRSRSSGSESEDAFNEVIRLSPRSLEAEAAGLMIQLDQKKFIAANMTLLQKLSDEHEENLMFAWLLGMACHEHYKATKSTKYSLLGADIMNKLKGRWSTAPVAFHSLYGDVMEEINQYGKALPHRRTAVKMEPTRSNTKAIARTLFELGQYDEAMEFIENIPEPQTKDPEVELIKAGIYHAKGESERGIRTLNMALLDFPQNSDLYVQLGDIQAGIAYSAKAAESYAVAVSLTNARACSLLGWYLVWGDPLPQDIERGLKLLERGAELGDAKAFQRLSRLYHRGELLKMNPVLAIQWLEKGVSRGFPNCMYFLAWHLMNPAHGIKGDKARAIALFEEGWAKGNVDCATELGTIYYYGKGVPIDYGRAFTFFSGAEQSGCKSGFVHQHIALCHLYGRGTPKSADNAVRYFEKAHALGYEDAAGMLCRIYSGKEGGGVDEAKAAQWDLACMRSGGPHGKVHLIQRYLTGRGVPADRKKAYEMIDLCILDGNRTELSSICWFLAADNEALDAVKAVEVAALLDANNPGHIDTMAMAYARSGEFEKAVELEKKAISMAKGGAREEYTTRLRLYEQKMPYSVQY